jgi:hypothetical protein
LIAAKDTKVPAPTAEIAALEPTPVRPPVSVIDPVLPMVLPTELVAVWVMGVPIVVVAGYDVSLMLATLNDALAPVALITAEAPTPLIAPAVIDAVLVTVAPAPLPLVAD